VVVVRLQRLFIRVNVMPYTGVKVLCVMFSHAGENTNDRFVVTGSNGT